MFSVVSLILKSLSVRSLGGWASADTESRSP